jgi:hypothetical protein
MRILTREKALTLAEQIDIRLSGYFGTHAVELARAAHLDGTPKVLVLREHTATLAVPSKDRLKTYQVVCDLHAGSCWCDCLAGQHHKACCHVGAAILFLRQMAKACSAFSTALEP